MRSCTLSWCHNRMRLLGTTKWGECISYVRGKWIIEGQRADSFTGIQPPRQHSTILLVSGNSLFYAVPSSLTSSRADLCEKKGFFGSGIVWLLRLYCKRQCGFYLNLLWITHTLWNSLHIMRMLKLPCGEEHLAKNWSLLTVARTYVSAVWGSHFGRIF